MSSALSEKIKQFYDASSGLWETIWGEHMHHGYYGADGQKQVERRQAQIDLIHELVNWTSEKLGRDVTKNLSTFIDVGCGIGGTMTPSSQNQSAPRFEHPIAFLEKFLFIGHMFATF